MLMLPAVIPWGTIVAMWLSIGLNVVATRRSRRR